MTTPVSTIAGVEPPEWLDIEREMVIDMLWHVEWLEPVPVVDRGRLPLCVILFEELPDE